jgi:hypothetical protein
MTTPRNLHALDHFKKGDQGFVKTHRVSRATAAGTPAGGSCVTAFRMSTRGRTGGLKTPKSRLQTHPDSAFTQRNMTHRQGLSHTCADAMHSPTTARATTAAEPQTRLAGRAFCC